jgi:hypothetical protein
MKETAMPACLLHSILLPAAIYSSVQLITTNWKAIHRVVTPVSFGCITQAFQPDVIQITKCLLKTMSAYFAMGIQWGRTEAASYYASALSTSSGCPCAVNA